MQHCTLSFQISCKPYAEVSGLLCDVVESLEGRERIVVSDSIAQQLENFRIDPLQVDVLFVHLGHQPATVAVGRASPWPVAASPSFFLL